MGRPKGSKNKPKLSAINNVEATLSTLDEQIAAAENTSSSLQQEMDALALQLADKKAELRTAKREQARLEKQRDTLQAAAEQERMRKEADELLSTFVASGKSLDDLKKAISTIA